MCRALQWRDNLPDGDLIHHTDRDSQYTADDSLALASAVVDLRVPQIVNATQGVHAVLPHDALLT
jgi:acetamidase/formamidase